MEAIVRSDDDKPSFREQIQINHGQARRVFATARCEAIISNAAVIARAAAVEYDRGPLSSAWDLRPNQHPAHGEPVAGVRDFENIETFLCAGLLIDGAREVVAAELV
jgi:hypothetical protein